MVFRPKYYPYPILAPFSQDYRTATFVVGITAERTADGKNLEFLVSLPGLSPTIESALADGFCKLVIDIDCPGTLFRRVLRVENSKVSVPVGEVLGDVSVTPLLLVDEEFDFSPDAANEVDEIFTGASPFRLTAGDPLAIGDTVKFGISHTGKTNNSLLQLVSNKNLTSNLFEVNTSGDMLEVNVSVTAHGAYLRMFKNAYTRPAFIMGVVKDAILLGISAIATGDDDVLEHAWAQSLFDRLSIEPGFETFFADSKEGNFDLAKAHRAAQAIIQRQGIDELVSSDD